MYIPIFYLYIFEILIIPPFFLQVIMARVHINNLLLLRFVLVFFSYTFNFQASWVIFFFCFLDMILFYFILFFWGYYRRAYSVALENARVQPVMTVVRKAVESGGTAAEGQKQIFWLRDPKSGNWIPESHFGEIDVAELRERLLPKKEKL